MRRAIVVLLPLHMNAACSTMTSWDGLVGSDDAGADATAPRAPNARAARDAGADTVDATHATAPAPADAAAHWVAAAECTVGELYCAGSLVFGAPNALYRCAGDGAAVQVETCKNTCTEVPDASDRCKCVARTRYCGGYRFEGDPNSLYECLVDGGGRLVGPCEAGCEIREGLADSCR